MSATPPTDRPAHGPGPSGRPQTSMHVGSSLAFQPAYELGSTPWRLAGDHCEVHISTDGTWVALAGGSSNMPVEVRCFETARTLATLDTGERTATSLAFRPQGKWLAVGTSNGAVLLWDVAQNRSEILPGGERGQVARMAWSYDGRLLATVTDAQGFRAWDVDARHRVCRFRVPGHVHVETLQLCADGSAVLFKLYGGDAAIIDLPSGKVVARIPLSRWTSPLCFLPHTSDRVLVAGGMRRRSTVAWYDIRTKRIEKVADLLEMLRAASLSPDRQRIVAAAWDRQILVIDLRTGAVSQVSQQEDDVRTVVCSEGAQRVVYSSGCVLRTVDCTDTHRKLCAPAVGHIQSVAWLLLDPKGRYLGSMGPDGRLIVWDLASRTQAEQVATHGRRVRRAALSPSGQRLAVLLGSGASKDTAIGVRSWGGGDWRELPMQRQRPDAVHWWRDHAVVALGKSAADIWLWDTKARKAQRVGSRRPLGEAALLASCCIGDRLWLLCENGQLLIIPLTAPNTWECHQWPEACAVLRCSHMYSDASGQHLAIPTYGGEVVLRDCQTHSSYVITSEPPYQYVEDLAWHPRAPVLAMAHGKKGIRFWDMESRSWLGVFSSHVGSVAAIAFSCDGTTLFTGTSNGLICAWRLEGTLKHASIAPS